MTDLRETRRPKGPMARDPLDEDLQDELPPLADDEPAGDGVAVEEDVSNEEETTGWSDDPGETEPRIGLDEEEIRQFDIPAEDNVSWIEEGNFEGDSSEAEEKDEDREGTWMDDGSKEDLSSFADEIVDDEKNESLLDDKGEEGPEDDGLDPVSLKLDPLDGGTEEELADGEVPVELEEADTADDLAVTSLLPWEHIGPLGFGVVKGCVSNGRLFVAGEGLFTRGEDSKLHLAGESTFLSDCQPNSIAVDPSADVVYIGTAIGGGVYVEAGAFSFKSLQWWLERGERTESLRESMVLAGVRSSQGFVLWGMDGEGMLFSSRDGGRSWDGPLVSFPAKALVSASLEEARFCALCEHHDRPLLLFLEEEQVWNKLEVPDEPRMGSLLDRPVLAVRHDTLLAGSLGLVDGAMLSTDGGNLWSFMPGLGPLSAAAVHPLDDRILFAACRDPSEGGGVVRISGDAGERWRDIFDLEKADLDIRFSGAGGRTSLSMITDLIVDPLSPDELIVISSAGVFVVSGFYS